MERGKRDDPLHIFKHGGKKAGSSEKSDQGLNIDYKDVKVAARGRELVLYICVALTAIYALEKASQILLCICKRLNHAPIRRAQNDQYLAAQ